MGEEGWGQGDRTYALTFGEIETTGFEIFDSPGSLLVEFVCSCTTYMSAP